MLRETPTENICNKSILARLSKDSDITRKKESNSYNQPLQSGEIHLGLSNNGEMSKGCLLVQ